MKHSVNNYHLFSPIPFILMFLMTILYFTSTFVQPNHSLTPVLQLIQKHPQHAQTHIVLANEYAVYQEMGAARYLVASFLLLMTVAVPIKMYLRWAFNLKYLVDKKIKKSPQK